MILDLFNFFLKEVEVFFLTLLFFCLSCTILKHLGKVIEKKNKSLVFGQKHSVFEKWYIMVSVHFKVVFQNLVLITRFRNCDFWTQFNCFWGGFGFKYLEYCFLHKKEKDFGSKGEKNKTQIGVWFFLVRPKKIRL